MTELQSPDSARFQSDVHIMPVRIYYEDTDAGGIVYYANYLHFAERARTELLRDIGVENPAMAKEEGLAFAVRNLTVDYRKPAHLDDLLDVHTRILDVGGATVTLEQVVRHGKDVLVAMEVRLACIKLTGGAARLPERVLRLLEPCHSQTNGTD